MKVNLDIDLRDEHGNVVEQKHNTLSGETLQLVDIASQSLITESDKDDKSMDNRLKRFDLFLKIRVGGELDLKSEDISLIKQCIESHRGLPLLLAVQAVKLIEGQESGLEKKDGKK